MPRKKYTVELDEDVVERFYRERDSEDGKLRGMGFWDTLNGLMKAFMDDIDNDILQGTKGMYSYSAKHFDKDRRIANGEY